MASLNTARGESYGNPTASVSAATQPEKFTFNVDKACVQKVKDAMKSGRRVELVYRQWAMTPLTIDSSYVIIDVKPVD